MMNRRRTPVGGQGGEPMYLRSLRLADRDWGGPIVDTSIDAEHGQQCCLLLHGHACASRARRKARPPDRPIDRLTDRPTRPTDPARLLLLLGHRSLGLGLSRTSSQHACVHMNTPMHARSSVSWVRMHSHEHATLNTACKHAGCSRDLRGTRRL